MRYALCAALAAAATLLAPLAPAEAGTIETIRSRGQLVCGVNTGNPGFALADSQGIYRGFEVDLCRAVAAAVLGKADAVRYVPLTSQNRFTALQSGEIDVLSRSATWTLTREAQLGLDFATVTFYDGQGFMVAKKLGVKSALDLKGASICILSGSTSELNVSDYNRTHQLGIKPIAFGDLDQARDAFFAGRCDAYTTDASGLAATRAAAAQPGDYDILPEIISKEPIALAVRQDDRQFAHVVRWTMNALITAEEQGITAATVDARKADKNPDVARLLGTTPGLGAALGLSESWAADAISQVGNYGEIFERNLGKGTALNLDRGINRLWSQGGLLYAPPLR